MGGHKIGFAFHFALTKKEMLYQGNVNRNGVFIYLSVHLVTVITRIALVVMDVFCCFGLFQVLFAFSHQKKKVSLVSHVTYPGYNCLQIYYPPNIHVIFSLTSFLFMEAFVTLFLSLHCCLIIWLNSTDICLFESRETYQSRIK